jgi:Family of unknown function (DUF6526)
MEAQTFENHGRLVPLFHFFALPVFGLNLVQSVIHWWKTGFHFDGLVSVLVAAALIALALCARIFALTVQDRVIRLEERQRFERLLPAEMQGRIGEFTVSQIVSLRFASDAELPGLAKRVADEKLNDRKAIKRLIKDWRADHLRA